MTGVTERGIEKTPSKIQPVLDALRELHLTDISTRLDAQHAKDPTVGIAIIHLTEIPPVTISDRAYHFHAGSFTDGAVVPHYHPRKGELPGQTKVAGPDDEPYIFITETEMNTAAVVDEKIGEWETRNGKPGEVFIVKPNVVHSARKGKIAFACPHDHLENYDSQANTQGNRVMTAELRGGIIVPLRENGMPPHYPKQK